MTWEKPVGSTVFVSQIVDCVQLGEATALPVTVRLNKATQHPQHSHKCLQITKCTHQTPLGVSW